jgi:PAS domain S-box-containing protein
MQEYPSLQTLRTGKPCSGVVMGVESEGNEVRWIKINTRPLNIGEGDDPDAVIISFSDITDLKQSAEFLRASEERYRLLADLTMEGIVLHQNGIALDVNAAMARMLGCERDELLNRNFSEFVHADDLACVQDSMTKDYVPPYTIRFAKKNGDSFFAEIEARNYQFDGKTLRVSAVRDISARIAAEEERRQLQAQLVQAQKMEAIGTLAGGIAHDFNNMLNAIIGYSEMTKDDSPQGSRTAKHMDKVLEASNRARNLVKQILTFSRQEVIQPIALDPAAIVKEAAALLRPSLPATITIQVAIEPGIPLVLADPTQLHQIVINLGANAFQAMEATGGTLRISLAAVEWNEAIPPAFPESTPGLFVCLAVEDTGPGIAPEIKDRMFDPFFTTKEVGRGTGMGLATVHGIVQKYGGFITCESKPSHGATFRVFLPALDGENGLVPLQEDIGEAAPSFRGKILFVDDEDILVELGQALLERIGYEVTVRTNSIEALATFQNDPHRFDAVITDQTMPGITGLDLARRMLRIRPDLPIILCTGYSNLVNEAQAKAWGIQGFAMKPLTKKKIAALLNTVLKGKKAQDEPRVMVRDDLRESSNG